MDAWFAPQRAALASLAALVSLLALLEPHALRGKHRFAVMATCGAVFMTGIVILATAAYALELHQPSYVFLTLCFAGSIIALSSAAGFGRLHYLYRRHERISAGAPQEPHSGAVC